MRVENLITCDVCALKRIKADSPSFCKKWVFFEDEETKTFIHVCPRCIEEIFETMLAWIPKTPFLFADETKLELVTMEIVRHVVNSKITEIKTRNGAQKNDE